MELPFAGLHQLCSPMLGGVDNLPEPQRDALHVAFGLTSGDAPDRFLVALATLSLLAEVARKRPLLCLIDDAQWLDAASGQVLGFVARRILGESVLMVFGIREPSEEQYLAGLPRADAGRPGRRTTPVRSSRPALPVRSMPASGIESLQKLEAIRWRSWNCPGV